MAECAVDAKLKFAQLGHLGIACIGIALLGWSSLDHQQKNK
jgi:hypothetical protein